MPRKSPSARWRRACARSAPTAGPRSKTVRRPLRRFCASPKSRSTWTRSVATPKPKCGSRSDIAHTTVKIYQHGPLAFLQHPANRVRRESPLAIRRQGRQFCIEPRASRRAGRTAAAQADRKIMEFIVAAAVECRMAAAGKCLSAHHRTAQKQFRGNLRDGGVAIGETLPDAGDANRLDNSCLVVPRRLAASKQGGDGSEGGGRSFH